MILRRKGSLATLGTGKSSTVLLPCPVDLRLLEFFRQLGLVQLLQVLDNEPIFRNGLSITISQKGDQLVALFGRKLFEKAGKRLGVTAPVIGQDMLQATGGVGLVFSVFA